MINPRAPEESVGAALRRAARMLAAEGIPDPARDCRLLMAYALGVGADRLTLHQSDPLPRDARLRFDEQIRRRAAREPVSRILGRRLFYGRSFRVTPDVLDPRPETEILVETALSEPFADALDLGTGSGCIAITLLAERSGAGGVATDISDGALRTAQENAAELGVADRLRLLRADWFAGIEGRFDLIVSNPPYISPDEMPALAPEVALGDPALALTDGVDGLEAYRRIAAGASDHLRPGGRLLVEIGPTQAEAVSGLLRQAGFTEIAVHPDLDGRDRVVAARVRAA